MAEKTMPWFRAYPEAASDPKFEVIALQTGLHPLIIFGAWWKILCIAASSPVRGSLYVTEKKRFSNAEVTVLLRISNDECNSLLAAFVELEMLELDNEGAYRVKNWDKRQFTSDLSTNRVKAWREKKNGGKGNTNETPTQRYSDVSETPPDTDTDTELNTIVPDGTSDDIPEPDGWPFDLAPDDESRDNEDFEAVSVPGGEKIAKQEPSQEAVFFESMYGGGRAVKNPGALAAIRASMGGPSLDWCAADVTELAQAFIQHSHIPAPRQKGERGYWVLSLRDMLAAGARTDVIQNAIAKMRKDHLTIKDPGSIRAVVIDMLATGSGTLAANSGVSLLQY